MSEKPDAMRFDVGTMQIRLQNVRLRTDVMLDDVSLESGNIRVAESETPGETIEVRANETKFRIMISEPHINEFLAANIPADAPLRNVRLALLSGKVRVTGQVIKSVLHLPVTLDATPVIENGVRIKLDCQAAKLGISLPAMVVELFELWINDNPKLPLNLAKLPIPVRLDEIRCEPGRLHVTGRAKLQWPPVFAQSSVSPFSTLEMPSTLPVERDPTRPPLPDADDALTTPALPV
jgi:hypothetical protein